MNTAKAYLKTEGSLNYRDCELGYYTYSMFDTPSKYRVNVNVSLHFTQNNFTKTLAIDEDFDKEDIAINYGIEQGKKFIDRSYELGKISIVKSDIKKPAKKNDKPNNSVKPSKNDKPKADKK